MFYDFAGDPEYYSSHAAIFENLASSKTGNNLIIIVVDLRDAYDAVNIALHYWVSFVNYQKFAATVHLAIVGSHIDLLPEDEKAKKKQLLMEFGNSTQNVIYYAMIDCRSPWNLSGFQKLISGLSRFSSQCELSFEASLLLGLLEKDFSNVTACPLWNILSHIRDHEICLPNEAEDLHSTLSELHDTGVLLLLGDHTQDHCHIVLDITILTKEAHQLLFSTSAAENLHKKYRNAHSETFKIGILPECVLEEILPPHITMQCLCCLQYCQEIKGGDIGCFVPGIEPDQSFFFFPALCKKDKLRVATSNHGYRIAWLARCDHDYPFDYFPPRFLHVLLLRLVFRFTLSAHQSSASPDHGDFQCHCTMWKTGVHWIMTEGVECMVELVNSNKCVVVITKSLTPDSLESCIDIFHDIHNSVMKSKEDFCHSIRPRFFLLRSLTT